MEALKRAFGSKLEEVFGLPIPRAVSPPEVEEYAGRLPCENCEKSWPGKIILTTKGGDCQECGKPVSEIGRVTVPPPEAFDEAAQANHPRHENATGRERCGMCKFKLEGKNRWRCDVIDNFPCFGPGDCVSFSLKPRKPRHTQVKPLRLAIPPGIHFLYFGRPRADNRHQGVMTVVWRINEERHQVEVGFSFCSPLDHWVKVKGKCIAIERLDAWPIQMSYLYQPQRLVAEIAQALMEHEFEILAQGSSAFPSSIVRRAVPGWTRGLAKRLKGNKRVADLRRRYGKIIDASPMTATEVTEDRERPRDMTARENNGVNSRDPLPIAFPMTLPIMLHMMRDIEKLEEQI